MLNLKYIHYSLFAGPYRKEITSKLGAISDFLENAFVQNLQEFIGFNKKTKRQISQLNQTAYSIFQVTDSSQFKNYLKVRKENLNEVLDKVSEATGKYTILCIIGILRKSIKQIFVKNLMK